MNMWKFFIAGRPTQNRGFVAHVDAAAVLLLPAGSPAGKGSVNVGVDGKNLSGNNT
jgi:hypothetical protein